MTPTSVQPRRMLASAVAGACAGSAFGLVETAVPVVLEWVRPSHRVLDSSSPDIAIASVAGFVLGGAIAGLVAAVPARASAQRGAAAATALYLALTLLALAIGDSSVRGRGLMTVVTLAIGLCVAWRMTRGAGSTWSALGGPWGVALLIGGNGRIALEALMMADRREAAIGAALVSGCVIVGARVAGRRARHAAQTDSGDARRLLTHAVAWGLVLALASARSSGIVDGPARALAPSSRARPTVVVIVLDTVRADHTSVHGYDRPTTPNLEALAQTAVTYASAESAGNTTITAHGALFTGRYASDHGAIPIAEPLRADLPTLATRLAEAGYYTMGVAANAAFVNPSLGFARGFDHFDSRVPGLRDGPRLVITARDLIPIALARDRRPRADRPYYRRADDVTTRVIARLQQAPSGAPLFLFANYMDAHAPYAAPETYASRFARGRPAIGGAEQRALAVEVASGRRRLDDREREALVDAYDAGIAFADAEIGRLLDALRVRGLFDDALIVVTADHGEAFDEHGVMAHGRTLYDHQVHVPLVIKFPRQASARTVEAPVGTTDIFPTILAAVGIEPRAPTAGQVLRVDAEIAARAVYAEDFSDPGGVARAAIGPGGLKVIVSAEGARGFDRRRDPSERDAIAAARDARFSRLLTDLAGTFASMRTRPSGQIPDDLRDRLRAWGYAQ